MIVDRDLTDRVSGLVRTPKVTCVRVGVLEGGVRGVEYSFKGGFRQIKVGLQTNSDGAHRFSVYAEGNRGSLAFDISEEFGDVWFSSVNVVNAFSGYGSLMLPFFHAFLLEQGCEGYPIGVSFYQHKKDEERDMVDASEKLFRRQFSPVSVIKSDEYLKDCQGVV
jgi:hypothetical protein